MRFILITIWRFERLTTTILGQALALWSMTTNRKLAGENPQGDRLSKLGTGTLLVNGKGKTLVILV